VSNSNPNRQYIVVNGLLAAVMLGIIGYSFMYDTVSDQFRIPSGLTDSQKQVTISSGLSRSFSSIVHFRFAEARAYNPYGMRIFLFFLLQLAARIALAVVLHGLKRPAGRWMVIADTGFSFLLFVGCFQPFIRALMTL
jgi:hypothetical protein